MSNQIVSVEAICRDCDRTDYFNGDTASDARQLAYLAGWRNTPEGDERLGLCPEHATTPTNATASDDINEDLS